MTQNTTTQSATFTGMAMAQIGHGLINQKSAENIIALANALPNIREGLFECIYGNDGNVDLALPVRTDDTETLQAILSIATNANAALMKSNAVTANDTESIWFEYDTSAENFNRIPGIFFNLNLAHISIVNNTNTENKGGLWNDVLKKSIEAIGTKNGTAENIAAMLGSIDKLNGMGFPGYIGIMKSRNEDLRLSVKIFDSAEIVNYLQSIGIQVNNAVTEKINTLAKLADVISLSLSFSNGAIDNTFGMELHVSKATDNELHQQILLHQLQQYGLCSSNEFEETLHWPKTGESGGTKLFVHSINHFKVIIENNAITTAKAYLHYVYNQNHNW